MRRALPQRQERLQKLAERDAMNPKTVAQWQKRADVPEAPMGPKPPRATALTLRQEAMGVACRRPTLLPLDDGLSARHSRIPSLTRSARHRCFQRHGISRLPEGDGAIPPKKQFKTDPLGSCPSDMAALPTAEGRLDLFVAIDRASTCAVAERHAQATRRIAATCLRALIAAVPSTIHTVLTDHGTPCTARAPCRTGADQ